MEKQKVTQDGRIGDFARMEEGILDFWERKNVFPRSVEKPAAQGDRETPVGDYVFYDGPPFGTGEPHYGHILSSIAKDVVPRFWTMKGYRVERRWGWDCHGLPIENIVEEEMGINGKKDIENMGVDRFNEACRARVTDYADVWDRMVKRIARWVDFENSYKTMDPGFMESVWWGFKRMWERGLVYEGRKVLLYCPRCETPVSNFEVAMDNSYKEVTDVSVYVKFRILDPGAVTKDSEGVPLYLLAWTTTPWTLPGNVALAVGGDIDYAAVKMNEAHYIVAEDKLEEVLPSGEYTLLKRFKGRELEGLRYEPLFDIPSVRESEKEAHYVALADFVTTDEGTGVVHTAVVYGEDDYNLGLELDLPVVPSLDERGYFNENVPQFRGLYFKDADEKIIEELEREGLLFRKESHTHSYPHCHRCDTRLFYNAIPAWFLNVDSIRERMLELNENINWFPAHLKHGRFAQGISQAPDWNISRNRYFATPIPVWKCDSCSGREVIGGVEELREKSGESDISDLHTHFVDRLSWKCSECGGEMKRIEEVFDCWVESGSMSFAQHNYKGESLRNFDPEGGVRFPAQFISEYISQTRAWFYVMHVISTALFDSHCFENVVATGVILNDKGEKMSKSKKNFPDPWRVLNEYGADALRLYLMTSSVMHAENLFFKEEELKDVFRKNIMLAWNVYKFYNTFVPEKEHVTSEEPESDHVLDKWIMALTHRLIQEVTEYMENYDLPRAGRLLGGFIDDLSTWYLRRSRERLKDTDGGGDREAATRTSGYVLFQLSRVMAPFTPFLAEEIWQNLTGNNYTSDRSVHLEPWPRISGEADEEVLEKMRVTREIVESGLAARDQNGIKVRQPLVKLTVRNESAYLEEPYLELIREEVNVREVELIPGQGEREAELDTELTPELIREGIKREVIRYVNALRKKTRLTVRDRIDLYWRSDSPVIEEVFRIYGKEIAGGVLADNIHRGDTAETTAAREVETGEGSVELGVKRIDR